MFVAVTMGTNYLNVGLSSFILGTAVNKHDDDDLIIIQVLKIFH